MDSVLCQGPNIWCIVKKYAKKGALEVRLGFKVEINLIIDGRRAGFFPYLAYTARVELMMFSR